MTIGSLGLSGVRVGSLYCWPYGCSVSSALTDGVTFLMRDINLPVHIDGVVRTTVGTLLVLGGDDGLQVLTLPSLLPSGVAICCIICRCRDLLGFVYGCLLYVISIHDIARILIQDRQWWVRGPVG